MERLLVETASLRAQLEQEKASTARRLESGEDSLPGLRSQVQDGFNCGVGFR
jgi:hypothetical protein